MIKTEFFMKRDDNVILVKTYSTENKYIRQVETGLEYDEAIDIGEKVGEDYKPTKYTYVETDKEIEVETEKKIEVEVEE